MVQGFQACSLKPVACSRKGLRMNRPVLVLVVAVSASACARQEPVVHRGPEATARAEAAERTVLAEAVSQRVPLRVQILDARHVAPDTVRLEMALSNRASVDGPAPDPAALRDAIDAMRGISLVDADGHRRMFPLRDLAGQMVWSGLETPGPGQRQAFWVAFPAPPGEKPRVTVVLPGLPPMRGVPVS